MLTEIDTFNKIHTYLDLSHIQSYFGIRPSSLMNPSTVKPTVVIRVKSFYISAMPDFLIIYDRS